MTSSCHVSVKLTMSIEDVRKFQTCRDLLLRDLVSMGRTSRWFLFCESNERSWLSSCFLVHYDDY